MLNLIYVYLCLAASNSAQHSSDESLDNTTVRILQESIQTSIPPSQPANYIDEVNGRTLHERRPTARSMQELINLVIEGSMSSRNTQEEAELRFTQKNDAAIQEKGADFRFTQEEVPEFRSNQEEDAELRSNQEEDAELRSNQEEDAELRSNQEEDGELRFTQEEDAELRSNQEEDAELRFTQEEDAELRFTQEEDAESRFTQEEDIELRFTQEEDAELRFTQEEDTKLKSTQEEDSNMRATQEESIEAFPSENEYVVVEGNATRFLKNSNYVSSMLAFNPQEPLIFNPESATAESAQPVQNNFVMPTNLIIPVSTFVIQIQGQKNNSNISEIAAKDLAGKTIAHIVQDPNIVAVENTEEMSTILNLAKEFEKITSKSQNNDEAIESVIIPETSEEVATEEVATEEVATEKVATEEVATEKVATEEVAIEEVATEEVATEEVETEEIATEEVETEEIATEEVETEEIATEEVETEEIATEEVETEEIATEEVEIEEVETEEVATKEIATEEVVTEKVATEGVATEEVAPEEVATEEVATEEVATEEVATEEVATEEVATEEVATEEVATEEVATEEVATEEVATEEVATEEVATEEVATEAETTDETESHEVEKKVQSFSDWIPFLKTKIFPQATSKSESMKHHYYTFYKSKSDGVNHSSFRTAIYLEDEQPKYIIPDKTDYITELKPADEPLNENIDIDDGLVEFDVSEVVQSVDSLHEKLESENAIENESDATKDIEVAENEQAEFNDDKVSTIESEEVEAETENNSLVEASENDPSEKTDREESNIEEVEGEVEYVTDLESEVEFEETAESTSAEIIVEESEPTKIEIPFYPEDEKSQNPLQELLQKILAMKSKIEESKKQPTPNCRPFDKSWNCRKNLREPIHENLKSKLLNVQESVTKMQHKLEKLKNSQIIDESTSANNLSTEEPTESFEQSSVEESIEEEALGSFDVSSRFLNGNDYVKVDEDLEAVVLENPMFQEIVVPEWDKKEDTVTIEAISEPSSEPRFLYPSQEGVFNSYRTKSMDDNQDEYVEISRTIQGSWPHNSNIKNESPISNIFDNYQQPNADVIYFNPNYKPQIYKPLKKIADLDSYIHYLSNNSAIKRAMQEKTGIIPLDKLSIPSHDLEPVIHQEKTPKISFVAYEEDYSKPIRYKDCCKGANSRPPPDSYVYCYPYMDDEIIEKCGKAEGSGLYIPMMMDFQFRQNDIWFSDLQYLKNLKHFELIGIAFGNPNWSLIVEILQDYPKLFSGVLIEWTSSDACISRINLPTFDQLQIIRTYTNRGILRYYVKEQNFSACSEKYPSFTNANSKSLIEFSAEELDFELQSTQLSGFNFPKFIEPLYSCSSGQEGLCYKAFALGGKKACEKSQRFIFNPYEVAAGRLLHLYNETCNGLPGLDFTGTV